MIRKKASKKAALLMYPLLIGLFLAICTYSFVKYIENPQLDQEYIGDYQLNLLKSSYDSEKILFYVDQSAKFSADQSLYELGNLGGGNDCGTYDGISLWGKNCFPKFNNNYINRFKINLEEFLDFYSEDTIPHDNYEYVIDASHIRGIALKPLRIDIKSNKGTKIGEYSIKPSFSIDTGIDIINIFNELEFNVIDSEISGRESIVKKVSLCIDEGENNLWSCVTEAKKHFEEKNPGYLVEYKAIGDEIYQFSIATGSKVMAYDSNDKQIKSRNLVIIFAIDFSGEENQVLE